MDLRQLFNDDDAVSPVIGVILMVAITVILAAVIATFVLGLGESVSDTAPQASFSYDYENVSDDVADDFSGKITTSSLDGNVTATHSSGATIDAGQLYVSNSSEQFAWSDADNKYGASSEISSGDSITIGASSGDTVSIIWQNEQNTDSATLSTYDV